MQQDNVKRIRNLRNKLHESIKKMDWIQIRLEK
ncbi:unknown [Clostridium sp. CAG:470]|nr:unknown [Clostridium sp. CAG:470]